MSTPAGPRRAIPAAIKRAIFARSQMTCEAEGCDRPGKELEHRIPVALGGQNTEENLWLSCRECHRAKTSGQDIPRIAKAKRQARETGRQREDKKRRAWPKRSFNTNRDGKFKAKIGGKVEKRT